MINFFKDKKRDKTENTNEFFSKVASLLIHAAKIDEVYTDAEKEIIKNTLIELGAKNEDLNKIMMSATINEDKSNQILDFTREVKNMPNSEKIKIVEALWKIIYSNADADMYETNLMRRLSGLLYIDNKTMSEIKEKIKKEFT